jgi:hypothetical protein
VLTTQTQLAGDTIMGVNNLKAIGNKFYARFDGRLAGGYVIAEFATSWSPLLLRGDKAPNGNLFTGFANYAVNRLGDIAVIADGSTRGVVLRTADGALHAVHALNEPTDAGDYLQNYLDLDLRSDRSVFFGGADLFDRYVLYRADPIF